MTVNVADGVIDMARTYVPTLRVVLHTAYKYATRWQPKLAGILTETQLACLADVITALASCLIALGQPDIQP